MNSQKAVENFYDWELMGRGYLLFPYPVSIEPSFRPFYHSYGNTSEYVDDGKVPTLIERLFPKKNNIISEEAYEEQPPLPFEYTPFLRQLNITFSKIPDIKDSLLIEFLNMFSESEDQISFEIIGRNNSLEIQFVCSNNDHRRINHLLKTYFPDFIVKDTSTTKLPFDFRNEILMADFGYNEEFIRPINSSIDGLIGLMAVLNFLRDDEIVMFQIIFKGIENPWSGSILNSVGSGKDSFFPDSPEMLPCAKEKISSPLFSAIFRLAVQSFSPRESERLATELIQNVITTSRSDFNSLIPLSNKGYDYQSHLQNLITRGTNRFGMVMNGNELSSFIRFPNSNKLINDDRKTKVVPDSLVNNEYLIGLNQHLGIQKKVTLNDSHRLRHCHIVGATGTGKSTLISNLFLEDVKHGNGCVIFDPHGDTIDEIIPHIPENRLKDVILIDPSDSEYSFSFNLLSAKTDVEKIVLSSDLVEAFRRHSTSWGDQMTSVLSNAINAFLESSKGGTLIELKRFILENSFRKEFLKTVADKSIHYYWDNEYILLKKFSISPLLTRLDTFLRPKIIRNILSQKEGLDFNDVLRERKILLVKLSQGLIGEESSYLLGTLILSKIYQVAQARQSLSTSERLPFYIYLDEFQNFITPSINSILSGARKYGIGLVLAHQELNQIKDTEIGNSVLSNANIRICFRLGDTDAKKLESGFSYFDSKDFQNLNIGEAIVRVGKNSDDFSLTTTMPDKADGDENKRIITENSRVKYCKKGSLIEDNLNDLLLKSGEQKPTNKEVITPGTKEEILEEKPDIEEKSKEYLETYIEKEEIREHRYLQTFIKKIAEQRGFKASIEEIVENGRIDVVLIKDSVKIACEIAVSNSTEYEAKNINKCINAGYLMVCVISKDERHLTKIREKAIDEIKDQSGIHFFTLNQMTKFLDSLVESNEKEVKRIMGYRVKVNYIAKDS